MIYKCDSCEAKANELHKAALDVIESLIDLNPSPGTPECKLLENLAAAVDQYEREMGMGRLSHE